MSRKNSSGGKVRVQKSKVKQRLEVLESTQAEGIDHLVTEVHNLHHNDMVIAHAMEQHDTTIAAMRSLLVEKGLLADEEIDERVVEIQTIRAKYLAAQKQAEAQAEQERQAELPDAELGRIHQAATEAGEDEGHPDGAFIFGG